MGLDKPEILPNETYQFSFSKDELNEIQLFQRKILYKKPVIFSLICILVLITLAFSSTPHLTGFTVGVLFTGLVMYIKSIQAYNKTWQNNTQRISKSVYEYKIYDDYLCVNIFRGNEKVREEKCYFSDIEQVQNFGNWLFLQYCGQFFILRKSDLNPNSVLFSHIHKTPIKKSK